MEGRDYPMSNIEIHARDLSKNFNRRPIFRDISFSLSSPDSIAFTGKNGSGKSTLAKIVAGVLSPTKGEVVYQMNGKALTEDERKIHVGFVSPYLNLYDEFTALENIALLAKMRSNHSSIEAITESLLKRFNLWQRRDDNVRGYSSGMKQRLKYVFALVHSPSILILDEPSTNLDNDGMNVVEEVVKEQLSSSILVVATNDSAEANWCKQVVQL